MKLQACPHIPGDWRETKPVRSQCRDCDSTWSLRMCLTCGEAFCCTSQQGHNRDHWKDEGHAVIRQMPVDDESFVWCWECNAYLDR